MKYFTMNEMCKTKTGYINIPNTQEKINIIQLVKNVLDPLREMHGKQIYVNSGYRSYMVNKMVGGAINSQHKKGQAADIRGKNKNENKIIFNLIKNNFDFDQLINENDYSWIHVSYKSIGNRKEVLHL